MKRALAVVVALVLAVSTAAGAEPSGPAEEPRARLGGLRAAARLVQDRFGITHVVAANDHDVFFLQGWIHARDRLFQMDLSRRQASGRRAELLGPDLLADDIQLRLVGIRRAAQRSLQALSPEARRVLEAYADGVNAWVDSHPLPSEYAEVEISEFEPWTALDSVAVGKLIAFGLSFDIDIFTTFDHDAYVAAGQANGFDGRALFYGDSFRLQPFDPASTLPDALRTQPRSSAALEQGPPAAAERTSAADRVAAPATDDAMRRWAAGVRQLPSFPALFDPDRFGEVGSNEWGVSGERTPSGRPIIANDPHLALDLPSTFAPIGLHSPGMDVVGKGFAGAPTVILGQNRHITWGATTNPLDVTDSYREQVVNDTASPSGISTIHQGRREPVVEIPEQFRVNNRDNGTADDLALQAPGTPVPGSDLGPVPESSLVVPRRNNGPLLLRSFSIQYTGFSATRELETFLRWNRARDLDDFRRGLDFFDVGSQNWAYADVEGNLGYFTSAEAPIREDLEAGRVQGNPPWLLRDGTGGNEWLPVRNRQRGQAVPFEILSRREMPQVLNPPAGFFVNANNDPAGTTLDNDPLNQRRRTGGIFYLNVGYDGFRGGRITQRLREELAGAGRVSFQEMKDIQADVALLDAQVFVPHLADALARARTSTTPALAALARDPRIVEAIGRLTDWDTTAPTGILEGYDASDRGGRLVPPSQEEIANSVAATIYSVWRGQFIRSTVDATLDQFDLPTPDADQALSSLRRLLERFAQDRGRGVSGLDFFAVTGVPDANDRRDVILLRSLAGALDLLAGDEFRAAFGGSTDQDDYRWGRLHRVVFEHPLGGDRNAPPLGNFATVGDLPGIPTDGGFNTVDASGHNGRADADDEFGFGGGPVRRYVGRADPDGIVGVSSLPGGASGLTESPFAVNLLGPWLTNETFPQELDADDFGRRAVDVQHLTP